MIHLFIKLCYHFLLLTLFHSNQLTFSSQQKRCPLCVSERVRVGVGVGVSETACVCVLSSSSGLSPEGTEAIATVLNHLVSTNCHLLLQINWQLSEKSVLRQKRLAKILTKFRGNRESAIFEVFLNECYSKFLVF